MGMELRQSAQQILNKISEKFKYYCFWRVYLLPFYSYYHHRTIYYHQTSKMVINRKIKMHT